MIERRRVASGSPFEAQIGFSRAVRVGNRVAGRVAWLGAGAKPRPRGLVVAPARSRARVAWLGAGAKPRGLVGGRREAAPAGPGRSPGAKPRPGGPASNAVDPARFSWG
jgi:hypothetical protein